MLGVMACTLTREEKVAGSSNVMGLTGSTRSVLQICGVMVMVCCT